MKKYFLLSIPIVLIFYLYVLFTTVHGIPQEGYCDVVQHQLCHERSVFQPIADYFYNQP